MNHSRRRFLQSLLAAPVAARAATESGIRLAPFRFDVTPPVGHPLCGGWIKPVVEHADSLEAIGYVLLGAGRPIVVCAVDWTGILNAAHLAWRSALAGAAGTTADRVAVHCVHQHDAPFVCLRGQELCDEQGDNLQSVDRAFFNQCLERGRAAIRAALPGARAVTHVARGEGRVEKVAGNRRVWIGPDGKVKAMRGSSCRVPELIALPEGLIDPMLKTVAFYSGAEKIVSCHYYATHPMSHYGAGRVSSDFPGLARKRRQQEEPGCLHLYFTGCAGNVAAGKYNPGTPEARVQLTQRLYDGICAAEKSLVRAPVGRVAWRTHEIVPEVNPVFTAANQRAMLMNQKNSPANRIRPAMCLAWIERVAQRGPITLSALHLGDLSLLHLPGECFVEYQLRAQLLAGARFVATAAYGDGGVWYVPVKAEYPKGGYEVGVAFCAPSVDDLLTHGMRELLRP
jgi:hypothetical protein